MASEYVGLPWEPKFTTHGFRYAQVSGWEGVSLTDLQAVVVHNDMEPTGDFEYSHALVTKLHEKRAMEHAWQLSRRSHRLSST